MIDSFGHETYKLNIFILEFQSNYMQSSVISTLWPYEELTGQLQSVRWHWGSGDILDFNTLRPRRNEQHIADYIFKRIFFNENIQISTKFSLKLVPKGAINNIPALVQIMAWRWPGNKPLSEQMMIILLIYASNNSLGQVMEVLLCCYQSVDSKSR